MMPNENEALAVISQTKQNKLEKYREGRGLVHIMGAFFALTFLSLLLFTQLSLASCFLMSMAPALIWAGLIWFSNRVYDLLPKR